MIETAGSRYKPGTRYQVRPPKEDKEHMAAVEQASGVGAEKESRPSPIDVHVGSRIRLRRTLLGMSQERLGEALGLTFQQVQKYERGVNRVGASRLFDLSRVLDVPISFFFDDMPDALSSNFGGAAHRRSGGGSDHHDPFGDDTLSRRETLELVRAYYRITDPSIRKRVFDLIKSMGPNES
jgi:transcriptional regulator with XRE-family HTH domain